MSLPPVRPDELFVYIVLGGMLAVLFVFLPVQMASKFRRLRAARSRITCRLCGYRFLRREQEAVCPHCGARNR